MFDGTRFSPVHRFSGIYNFIHGLYSDTDGFAIYMAATTNHNYIARNYCMYGLANLTNDAFMDLATDGKNAWVANYEGNEMVYPATS